MPSSLRTRSRRRMVAGGSVTFYNIGRPGIREIKRDPPTLSFAQTTEDYTGKTKRTEKLGFPRSEWGLTPCSDLWSDKMYFKRNADFGIGHARKFENRTNFWADHSPALPIPGKAACIDQSLKVFAPMLWAKTNPYRTEVSAWVILGELLEIASLFRITLDSFRGMIAGHYLNINFGWIPFLSDLKKLSDITSIVESRAKELESMCKPGGLRRSKIFLHANRQNVISDRSSIGFFSDAGTGQVVFGSFKHVTSYTVTGSCRWRFRGNPPPLTKLQAFNIAVKKCLSLEAPTPEDVWELIPFSWLIDYFMDVSTWLSATKGRLEIEPFDTCIMFKGKGNVYGRPSSLRPRPGSDIRSTGFHHKRYSSCRIYVPTSSVPWPTPTVSFLTMKQTINIAAVLTVLSTALKRR